MVLLVEAKSPDDDWSGLASKAERRKRQNRLNQRARRRRKGAGVAQYSSGHGLLEPGSHLSPSTNNTALVTEFSSSTGLPEQAFSSHCQNSTSNSCLALDTATSIPTKHTGIDLTPPVFSFPLTSDHLITLVQYNVYRACISNIILLDLGDLINEKCKFLTSSLPPYPIPANLCPTPLQQSIPHLSWIDLFPDPNLRDNMVLAQGLYDERSLFNDIIGEICGSNGTSPRAQSASILDICGEKEGRGGLIVWSDPWDVNSWEVTPAFLKKWGWMLRGCSELLASSNRWRVQREEEPLLVDVIRLTS